MSDFINKIVTIILIFVLLIIAPLVNVYTSEYSMSKREILNDTSSFIDQVIDEKTLSADNINKFYTQCNSHGLAVDVTIKRLIKAEIPDADQYNQNSEKTVYYSTNVTSDTVFNPKDIVKVEIQEVGVSTARRVIYNISRIDNGRFEFSLAGEVK